MSKMPMHRMRMILGADDPYVAWECLGNNESACREYVDDDGTLVHCSECQILPWLEEERFTSSCDLVCDLIIECWHGDGVDLRIESVRIERKEET